MVQDKNRFYFDLIVVIAVLIAIVYLRLQLDGEVYTPFDGVQAVLNIK